MRFKISDHEVTVILERSHTSHGTTLLVYMYCVKPNRASKYYSIHNEHARYNTMPCLHDHSIWQVRRSARIYKPKRTLQKMCSSLSGAKDYNNYDKQNINDTTLQCQVHKYMHSKPIAE